MNWPWSEIVGLIAAIDAARKVVITEEKLAEIPPQRRVEKPAAAALILPPNWEDYLGQLRDLPILLGKSHRGVLEVLGGGLQSKDESVWDSMMSGATFPDLIDKRTSKPVSYGGSFYHLQAFSILTRGEMAQVVYNTKGGEHDLLAALREVVEEGVVHGISIVAALSNSVNVGVPFSPFNLNLRRVLEAKFPGMYDGTEPWAQIVVQKGFLATVETEAPALPEFSENAEISGLKWVTLAELLELAKAKTGHEVELPAHLKDEKLRNSIPLHFVKWFAEWLIAQQREFSW